MSHSTFNPKTHSLGKLCRKGHEYEQTGKSVRRISDAHCVLCHNEGARRRKHARTIERPVGMIVLPDRGSPEFKSVRDRTLAKIVVSSSGCWEWQGGKDKRGYGKVSNDGRDVFAHRLIWAIERGALPVGLEPAHLCRNRSCCNPDHLEWVTHRENVIRGDSPSAISLRSNCCHRGHEFTPDNTKVRNDGYRQCRTCFNEWKRQRYHTRKLVERSVSS